jgi:outer membrane protein
MLSFLGLSIAAQIEPAPVLTLEEAIAIGLKNNFDIIIAKNEAQIASKNNSLITTGFVPSLSGNLAQNNSISNTRQEFFNGTEQQGDNAGSNSLNAGLQLNWTIFDGARMFVTKNKLDEIEKLSNMQTRTTVENTVAAIQSAYYSIVQQEQYVKVIEDALQLSRERLKIADAKLQLGSASELAVLQTKTDMNVDSSNLLQFRLSIIKTKAVLNELLARDASIDFLVESKINFSEQLDYETLKAGLENENPQMLAARINKEIAALNVKELKTNYGPRVNVFGAYNYTWLQNEVGFLKSNVSFGPAFGLTASINLFDGMQTRRQKQIAKVEVMNAQTNYQSSLNKIQSSLYQAYQDYSMNLQMVKLEAANISVAEKNVTVAMERYKLGSINDIELRETQLKYIEAKSRLLLAQYNTKMAEVELFRLTGKLRQ